MVMDNTISRKLNHLPHKVEETPFGVWFKCYNYHLRNIFNIFFDELIDIEPFSSKNFKDEKYFELFFERFSKMIYKKSSRVV
jgi:hypothetical protein